MKELDYVHIICNQANDCLEKNDIEGAKKNLEMIIQIAEFLPEAQEELAYAYGNLSAIYNNTYHDSEKAEEILLKCLEINQKLNRPDHLAITYGNLGLTYYGRGDFTRAKGMLMNALSINEQNNNLKGIAIQSGLLGDIFQKQNELDKAENMLNRSLDAYSGLDMLDPMIASNYYALGLIEEKKGSPKKACKNWIKSCNIYNTFGMTPMVTMIKNRIKRMDDEINEPINRAVELAKIHKYDEAIKEFEKIIGEQPSDIAYYNLGLVYSKKQDFNNAIKNTENAVKIDPQFAEAYYNLGNWYFFIKDFKKALNNYCSAFKIDPHYIIEFDIFKNYPIYEFGGFSENELNKGIYISKQGRHKDAIDYYFKFLEDGRFSAVLCYDLGLEYFFIEDYYNAIVCFWLSIKHGSQYESYVYSQLGVCLQSIGKYKEAFQSYVKALSLNPNDENALANIERVRNR